MEKNSKIKNLFLYKAKRIKPSQVFIVGSILGIFAIVIVFYSSHGDMINRYFFCDVWDTGMDFFHSIEYLRGFRPYEQFNTLYPPLANLLFALLFHLIPDYTANKWAWSFEDSLDLKVTVDDPRLSQAPMLLFIVYIIISTLLVSVVISTIMKNKSEKLKWGLIISSLFSYPVMFAYERGNIIIISWAFTLIFLSTYQNPNRWIRELGIISLAVAVGLKLYPVAYGLLLLKKNHLKEAGRAIVYGIIVILVPLLFFGEGIGGLRFWIDALTEHMATIPDNDFYVFSAKRILNDVIAAINSAYGIPVSDQLIAFFSYMICAVFLASSFTRKEVWLQTLDITMAMLLFSSQGVYGLTFFLLPLLLVIKDSDAFQKDNYLYIICMILIVVQALPLLMLDSVILLCLILIALNCGYDLFLKIRTNACKKAIC